MKCIEKLARLSKNFMQNVIHSSLGLPPRDFSSLSFDRGCTGVEFARRDMKGFGRKDCVSVCDGSTGDVGVAAASLWRGVVMMI
jgi:hypothetical protein